MNRTTEEIDTSILVNAATEAALSRRNLATVGRLKTPATRAAARKALEARVLHFARTPDDWARAEEATARDALALFDAAVTL
jgi:hypothetical protein